MNGVISCLILSRPVERKLVCTLLLYEQYTLILAKNLDVIRLKLVVEKGIKGVAELQV